jgi:hypothetical protein
MGQKTGCVFGVSGSIGRIFDAFNAYMRLSQIILLILFMTMWSQQTIAQKTMSKDSNLIQFSGLLLSSDSIYPIPFANIYVLNKPYGTYSNLEGYFSFVAKKGDTIAFSHVEFKRSYFVIPDTLKEYKYSIVKLMTQDTVHFPGIVILPMPNRATFDHLFVTKSIPNDDFQRAKNNMEREALREQAMSMEGQDAAEAYRQISSMYAQKAYYSGGQIPPMNILNPFAWAQFFEAWKRGDFKRKKTK